jgi:hypothetical protein
VGGKFKWALFKGFLGVEFLGEVVAEFMGLNESKYQVYRHTSTCIVRVPLLLHI